MVMHVWQTSCETKEDAGKCSQLPGSTAHGVSSLSSITAGSGKITCNRIFTAMWHQKFDLWVENGSKVIQDDSKQAVFSTCADLKHGFLDIKWWTQSKHDALTWVCSAESHQGPSGLCFSAMLAQLWLYFIRCLSSSVCSCQCCKSLHVSRARDEPNMKHEAEDTPQFDIVGAHCGVMLTLLNLSTIISDIKGQAVNSRWSFCRPVSLFLDSDLILRKWNLLTRLYSQTGGNFHSAKCAFRRMWTHARHNKGLKIHMNIEANNQPQLQSVRQPQHWLTVQKETSSHLTGTEIRAEGTHLSKRPVKQMAITKGQRGMHGVTQVCNSDVFVCVCVCPVFHEDFIKTKNRKQIYSCRRMTFECLCTVI